MERRAWTILNRNGKANGEANKEEQAEDVQVVAHLVQQKIVHHLVQLNKY